LHSPRPDNDGASRFDRQQRCDRQRNANRRITGNDWQFNLVARMHPGDGHAAVDVLSAVTLDRPITDAVLPASVSDNGTATLASAFLLAKRRDVVTVTTRRPI
jgi:hypothetical protein